MKRNATVAAATALLVSSIAQASPLIPHDEAFREGMRTARWSSANKQFVGTAYEAYDSKNGYSDESPTAPLSKVWFTGGRGILNEVMWPSVDTPQVRDSQLLISDGATFFFEERTDSSTQVAWVNHGVPAFRVVNADPLGRFTIEKTIFTDPDRDVVLQHIRFERHMPGLNVYYQHKPGVSNTPMGNSGRVALDGLYAWQGNQAQAVVFSVPLKAVSAGFEGASDGWQDLHSDFRMDYTFETATKGNVVETAWLDLGSGSDTVEFDVAIGFGADVGMAGAVARAALEAGSQSLFAKYTAQWAAYQSKLVDLSSESGDGGALFRASIAVLKSSEDKTSAGAIVASPTVPWGNHHDDGNTEVYRNGSRAHQTGGYHLVWPRDLYQMASTFLAVGDPASAVASLDFLKAAQYGPDSGTWQFGFRSHGKDGSFPQNCWTNGEVYWAGLQMDEVAMPVVLAYRLWQAGKSTRAITGTWCDVRPTSSPTSGRGVRRSVGKKHRVLHPRPSLPRLLHCGRPQSLLAAWATRYGPNVIVIRPTPGAPSPVTMSRPGRSPRLGNGATATTTRAFRARHRTTKFGIPMARR